MPWTTIDMVNVYVGAASLYGYTVISYTIDKFIVKR